MGFVVGFIVAGALQEMLEAKKRSWSKRIAADCRSISAALESYRGDHGSYPPLDGKIEHLTPYLTPNYLRQLPTRNMSGQPYLVVLNGARATVISVGSHGAAVEAGDLIAGGIWNR